MKNPFPKIYSLIIAGVIAAAVLAAPVARAQEARTYTLLNGGTNKVTALASNQPIYLNVSEFAEIALQASVAAPSGNSNALFYVYRSADSIDYETQPVSALIAQSATSTNVSFTNITLGATATLKIVPANTNSGNYLTNLILKARFKAAKQKLSS